MGGRVAVVAKVGVDTVVAREDAREVGLADARADDLEVGVTQVS